MRKIALLVVIFLFSTVSAFAQIPVILNRMDLHRKALRSLRAALTISKFSASSGGTYTKEGILTIVPQKNNNNLVRIDSTEPETENFLIVKNQFLVYLPGKKTAYTGAATDSQKDLFFLFSDLSKEKLKADYNVVYNGEEKVSGTIPTWHLELTPKTPANYQTMDIWIDANGMPIQFKITENNGDWTNVLLAGLQKNVRLNAAEFKIALPKGTKIIKN
jgi:outer membrane lipoprotein-sorting protein